MSYFDPDILKFMLGTALLTFAFLVVLFVHLTK